MDEQRQTVEAGLKQQLEALYAEREQLHDRLGTADSEQILRMIDSLKEQLEAIYGEAAVTQNDGH